MLGLPTRLVIADRVFDDLTQQGGVEADAIHANRSWYMLGALGPALGDFVPHEPPLGFGAPGRTPYYTAWKLVLQIAVGDASQSPPIPGAVPTLRTLISTLNNLTALVQAHDFDGVVALRDSGALDAVNNASADLAAILQNFSNPSYLLQIGNAIGPTSMPRINNATIHPPVNTWTGRDYLHWKRTGDFAAGLLRDAAGSGDDRLLAYAVGWQVAFAALVSGSGFLASIVGSVYRTHWWRTRYIGNYVDAWVWGNYHRGGAGPTAYDDWPSLCNARLHDWIGLDHSLDPEAIALDVVGERPLPAVLPQEFTDYWLQAWNAVYAGHDPTIGTQPLFNADRLQAGYAMTWLVLWFQTSGDVIGCNPNPGAPPSACGSNPTPPDWADPTQTNPATGQPFSPPTPNAEHDPSVGEVVCGVILGLLGVVATAFGGGAIGIPAIVGGIGLIVDGEKQLNWDELECQLYWTNIYVFTGLGALHKLTVLGGFQQPYASQLAAQTQTVSFGGASFQFVSAAERNCRSRELAGPLRVSNGAILDWAAQPSTSPLEEPARTMWSAEWWPSAVVDDDATNPVMASIATGPPAFDSGVGGSFGPAKPNALTLINQAPDPLPNWNLDSDRGRGWLTWELHAPYAVPVDAYPES